MEQSGEFEFFASDIIEITDDANMYEVCEDVERLEISNSFHDEELYHLCAAAEQKFIQPSQQIGRGALKRSFEETEETIDATVKRMRQAGPSNSTSTLQSDGDKALKGIPRESYVIGSKVGRYELAADKMFDFSAERTEAAVDNTLRLLGLDYVDIIQIHDCTFAPGSIVLKETLPALERAVRDGKARYIGLADYDIGLMKDLVEESEVKISTVLSYSKSSLFDNRLQNYTSFFKSNGVGVINAAATGMGLLCNRGPQPWHPASQEIKDTCRQAAEYCKTQKVELARLATWFSLVQPGIDTNICGFYNLEQLKDTIDVLENGLTEHENKILNDVQIRYFNKEPLHWDNVELPAYKEKINNLKNKLLADQLTVL